MDFWRAFCGSSQTSISENINLANNHEAVKIGDLQKTLESHSVVKPQYTADVPLVDEDRHAACHAIYKGLEGPEWEEVVLQVRGNEQGRQPSPPEWD